MNIPTGLRCGLAAVLVPMAAVLWAQKTVKPIPGGTGAPAGAAPGAKKEEPGEGRIVGTPIARPGGKWLGLSIEGGGFRLGFYDAKRKPVAVDAARATARWNPSQRSGQMTTVLLPAAGGKALSSGKFVPPPRVFKVFLSLINEQGEVLESHVVDFRE